MHMQLSARALLLSVFLLSSLAVADEPVGSALRVSENGRYLVDAHGEPFFWLGDTAWLITQKTTRDDVELYLKTRAEQGFTVIQPAFVMGEERVGGTLVPNSYGDRAFVGGNPAQPLVTPGNDVQNAAQYDYWDNVDYIVERAAAHGLTLAALPLFIGAGGDGYKYLTVGRAYDYGVFLGTRYRDNRNLIWVLGGDHIAQSGTEDYRPVWNELARGIAVGVSGSEDYSQTLMTFHPRGGYSSSAWFHTAPWLDFNMVEVWGDEKDIYPKLSQDYQRTPRKPTVLGEGSYENGPQYPTKPINARNIRKQAYWSYFAGGNYTYGNTDTWNFGTVPSENVQDWKEALHAPGAEDLAVLARLIESLDWWKFVPDESLFASGKGSGDMLNVAMRTESGDQILAYLSSPASFALRLDGMTSAKAQATWFDPRTGEQVELGEVATGQVRWFSPPTGWEDAVLHLTPVPEPSTLCLLGAGLLGFVAYRRGRRSWRRG